LKRKAEWVKLSVRTSVIPQHILPGHFGRARGHFGARSVAYFAEIRIKGEHLVFLLIILGPT